MGCSHEPNVQFICKCQSLNGSKLRDSFQGYLLDRDITRTAEGRFMHLCSASTDIPHEKKNLLGNKQIGFEPGPLPDFYGQGTVLQSRACSYVSLYLQNEMVHPTTRERVSG